MASSDLLIQSLLGGQQQMDPAVAALQPRMQMAQAMMQQGMDASPTTKWGGMSRLASALAGAYGMNGVQGGLQDIANQRRNDAANFASSLGDTLTPPPMPQAQAAPQPAQQPAQPQAAALPAAVHQLESSGSMAPGITGDGGAAAGPMQVHQAALDDVNKANGTNYTLAQVSSDPAIGKSVGDSYLKLQQDRFPGRPDLALAAYNAGPTATQNAVNSGAGVAGLPPSTQAYVARGMTTAGGMTPSVTQEPPPSSGNQFAGPGAPSNTGAPPSVTQAPPPSAPQAPQTGPNNPYVAKALQTIHQAQAAMIANPYNPQIQKAGQMAIDNAHTMMGMDSFATNSDGTQTNLRTGQVANAATPNAHYAETAPGSGVYADSTGTHAPTFKPAGRIAFNPNTGEGYQSTPAGPVSLGTPNPNEVSSLNAAKAQGAEAGKNAPTVPQLAEMLHESTNGIGVMESAKGQLAAAAKNGIPTGYFTPALATAAQALKSLGVDTSTLGVPPEGVSDIGAARKSLAVASGAIMRTILGPNTQITDSKLEHYIDATPGLETDPGALQKIMGWAESQLNYNKNMAMDGLKSANPQTGIIPGGWQSQYLVHNGGGPIYDPISGEMKQPNGQGPAAGMPSAGGATPPAAPAAPAYREGQTASGPGGAKLVFTGGHWVPK